MNGRPYIVCDRTITRWHLNYRRNYECFPNPNQHRMGGKAMLPRLLEENEDLKEALLEYARENISELSAELLYNYLHEQALPTLVKSKQEELGNKDYSKEDLFKEHQEKNIPMRMVQLQSTATPTKNYLQAHPLSSSLNTVFTVKATGIIIIWSYSWRTALIA
jgi:hypothetical protein